ncbi:MAG: hypothetical protein HY904_03740 [Deltaproteobacteria bacterium]|nr:hypothetical protein [Deltaproteobacteria bacterium]
MPDRRPPPAPCRVLLWLAATGACGPRPATLLLDPVAPIHGVEPRPLPGARVLDAAGRALDPQPPVAFTSAEPATLEVRDGMMRAWRSGRVVLQARVTGSSVTANTEVDVRLVDRLELGCGPARECVLGVGETLALEARAFSGRVPLPEHPVEWTAPPDDVLQMHAPGRFTGRQPGRAVVVARAGPAVTQLPVRVVERPDRVEIRCPDGHDAPTEIRPDNRTACAGRRGETLALGAVFSRAGAPLPAEAATWSSSDTAVAVVDGAGRVELRGVGFAVVNLRAGALEQSVDIHVAAARPGASAARCRGQWRHSGTVQVVTGDRTRSVSIRCDAPAGLSCVQNMLHRNTFGTPDVQAANEACCCR